MFRTISSFRSLLRRCQRQCHVASATTIIPTTCYNHPPPYNTRHNNIQHRSFSSRFGIMIRNVFSGDDHVNPKKLLERRYIYLALLAIHFRTLRINNNCNRKEEDKENEDTLYNQVVDELDAKDFDRMSNVQLRQELQNALHPQVLEIFQAFHRVDERLSLSNLFSNSNCSEEENDGDDHDDPFENVDWDPLTSILVEEHERIHQQLLLEEEASCSSSSLPSNNEKSNRRRSNIGFLERKLGALETILQFHQSGMLIGGGGHPRQEGDNDNNKDFLDNFGLNLRNITREKSLRLIRHYQTLNLARSALIRQELGYSVLTLQSLIPGAGRGVFLDGKALAGSVVAFQPGDIWPKEHLLTNSSEVMEHFAEQEGQDDCQISLRFDDYVVDSRESPVTVLTREGSMNPWALGHMVNHPPPKVLPNCQSTMLNYTGHMQLDHLLKYVPNTYARQPGMQSRFFDPEEVVMHGLCLVTRHDSSNEELAYDYRLQSNQTPEWYSIVDYYGDTLMDKEQVVFFRDDWMKPKNDKEP